MSKGTKTMKRLCWILIIVFSVFGTEVFSKEWNGIIPCVSTRSDAEKILGKVDFPVSINSYRYKKFRVTIDYKINDKNNRNKDIVEMIYLYPDKSETLSKYIKTIPNFQKDFEKYALDMKVTHVYGRFVYRNKADGFQIWVHKNEKDEEIINSFEYFDPAWDCSKRKSDSSVSN